MVETRTRVPATEGAIERHAGEFSILRREGPWKDALRRRMLAGADVLAAIGGALAAAAVEGSGQAIWAVAGAPAWLVLAKLRGLYDRDHVRVRHETVDEISDLASWVTLCVAATALVLALLVKGSLSAVGAIVMWAVALLLVLGLRVAARIVWRRLVPPDRGLVIGEGPLADALARKLALESGHHLRLADRIQLDDSEGSTQLDSALQRTRADRVIVALHDLDEPTLVRVASACRSKGVKLSVAPPLRAMFGTAVDLNHLAELPLIEFRTWDPSRSTMFFKRAFDVIGASVGLVLSAPLLALAALAVKLDTPGPFLFRQRRGGKDGAPFTMLKLRTMVCDAQERVGDVIDLDELVEPAFKVRGDPRVTRVGRLLRRWSLDELPQLVNVVRGEMSLVGPRPEETWLVDRYGEAEGFRQQMRPGISGPMQVHGRGELSFQERMAVEREYVENYSMRKDLQILLRTIAAVVRGHGAF